MPPPLQSKPPKCTALTCVCLSVPACALGATAVPPPLQPLRALTVDHAQVTEAARLAKDMRPELFVEGPIQYDAAVDRAVAEVKIKGHSDVAGRANVCIFPDLNTGNNTYKVRELLHIMCACTGGQHKKCFAFHDPAHRLFTYTRMSNRQCSSQRGRSPLARFCRD